MKRIKILTVVYLVSISLFGCTIDQDDKALNGRENNERQNVRYDRDNDDLRETRNDRNNMNDFNRDNDDLREIRNDRNNMNDFNQDNDNFREIRHDRNNMNDVNRDNDNQTRLEVADKAADRIVELDEVDRANVIVTNRNAYVAVALRNGVKGEVTDQLENKIADQVRAADSDIRNVFVSSNPDFVDRMRDYTGKIDKGEPVEGLFEEFNEAVRRVFPNAR